MAESHLPISFSAEEVEKDRLDEFKDFVKEYGGEAKAMDVAKTNFAPGTFGYHEAFHTASVLLDTVGRNLLEHNAVMLDPVAYKIAHDAHTALFNLYQYMGSKHS